MLCYQGLGDTAGAGRQQVMYKRFKADEAAQFITGPYRQLHPHDNNERQPIHEHQSARLKKPTPTTGYAAQRRKPSRQELVQAK